MENVKKRYHIIDTIRGVCIILVVLYHLIYDLTYIFPIGISFIASPYMNLFRDSFVGVLIFISGVSCNFSKSNFKRGIKLLVIALIFSFVTYFLDMLISFGILHFFGVSLIITSLLSKYLKKLPCIKSIVFFIILFFVFYIVNPELPNDKGNIVYFILGLTPFYMYSSDYYPLIPWIFLIFSGYFFGIYMKKYDKVWYYYGNKVLNKIGKHTLIIYIIHQPIILALLYIILI